MSEREAFEKWAELDYPLTVHSYNGYYLDDRTFAAWHSWQQAYALGIAAERERAAKVLNMTQEEIIRIRNLGCGVQWPKVWNVQLTALCDCALAVIKGGNCNET